MVQADDAQPSQVLVKEDDAKPSNDLVQRSSVGILDWDQELDCHGQS
jgi:hypothetical protein